MGKTRYYDCLNCKEYDSVEVSRIVTNLGVETRIQKCTSCGQYHALDGENNLVKYTEDGKE